MAESAPHDDDAQTPALAEHEREQHSAYSRWLLAGIPAAIAALSFALSLYIWYDTNQPPEVELTLPDRVRVTQGNEGAWLYIQPRFVSTAANDRIDVITNLQVDVTPLGEGSSTPFDWDEQGTWVFDHDSRSLTWDWVADPGPLVVSPANPQMPTGLFMAPLDWFWEPGAYEIKVTAEATVSDEIFTETSILTLSEDSVGQLNDARGSLFLAIGLAPAS